MLQQPERAGRTAADGGCKLIDDILLEIYDAIGHAPSQACSALSCKRFARIANLADRSSNLGIDFECGGLYRQSAGLKYYRHGIQGFREPGRRLCPHCLVYKPAELQTSWWWRGRGKGRGTIKKVWKWAPVGSNWFEETVTSRVLYCKPCRRRCTGNQGRRLEFNRQERPVCGGCCAAEVSITLDGMRQGMT